MGREGLGKPGNLFRPDSNNKPMGNKIDPWKDQAIRDYAKLLREFGIQDFRPLARRIPEPSLCMRRGIIFGHRNFGRILDAVKKKQKFVMLTGLMPSGRFHIGHKMVADEIIYLQGQGARTYLLVADIEAYNMRGGSLDELRKTAIEEYLINYIALGLRPRNCDFYFQSQRSRDPDKANAYYRLIGMVSKRTTFNEMKAIYGELTPGKIMSVFTQVSDILHPQLPEFEGPCPVVVPVGVDQDPHIKLTRDIVSRMKGKRELDLMPPSSLYHEFMPGLKGGKMSSSDPYSYIALTDDPGTVKEKINKYAFSGGQPSVAEHRRKGGNPDIDVAFQMLRFMFEPDDRKLRKIHDDYRSGRLLTGELKQIATERITEFLRAHRKKRKRARKLVPKFLK
jgi:tryptophanyl-tRNA synthetase